jgi:2-polyprenyl-3-methyl-5-hydroxy-6-metoxy-1,4-benzoquinol methylase
MLSQLLPNAGEIEVLSLAEVREKNFRFICKIIKEKLPEAKTVLDVGSSIGHFLKVANEEGLSITGLEPAVHLANETRAQGYEVINDFFPHAKDLEKYDIIIFNDSLEHILDMQETLQGIKDHLKNSGLVIINLPSSDGIIFKISFLLYKLGIKAYFDRLWQKGFASPHLHYFNKKNLKQLFENNGFAMRYSALLPFYTLKGLWKRISCKSSFFVSIPAWLCMIFLYPLFRLKSDIFMACFSFPRQNSTL